MTSIKRSVSTKETNGNNEIYLRVYVDRDTRVRLKTSLYIPKDRMKDNGEFIYPRANQVERERLREVESKLITIERKIIDFCESHKGKITKDLLYMHFDPSRAKSGSANTTVKINGSEVEAETISPHGDIVGLFYKFIFEKDIVHGTRKQYVD